MLFNQSQSTVDQHQKQTRNYFQNLTSGQHPNGLLFILQKCNFFLVLVALSIHFPVISDENKEIKDKNLLALMGGIIKDN